MSSRKDDPLIVIPYLLDKNDERQKHFERTRDRTRRKFNARIRKAANAAHLVAGLEHEQTRQVTQNQDERKKLFTEGMIGSKPAAWTMRTKPEDEDLPKLPRMIYYDSPGYRPKPRFLDPKMFAANGLSAEGKARLASDDGKTNACGLPPGWTEHRIGDTFSKKDGQTCMPCAIALDDTNATIIDEGRVYFYHEETGVVSWAPPKGSSLLAQECFLHFGFVLASPPLPGLRVDE